MQWKLFLYVWSYLPGWVEISTWGRWAGLGYKRDTWHPPLLMQYEYDYSSPLNHQSIWIKVQFIGTTEIVSNTDLCYFCITFCRTWPFKLPLRQWMRMLQVMLKLHPPGLCGSDHHGDILPRSLVRLLAMISGLCVSVPPRLARPSMVPCERAA